MFTSSAIILMLMPLWIGFFVSTLFAPILIVALPALFIAGLSCRYCYRQIKLFKRFMPKYPAQLTTRVVLQDFR